jgi:hypothetical protein
MKIEVSPLLAQWLTKTALPAGESQAVYDEWAKVKRELRQRLADPKKGD